VVEILKRTLPVWAFSFFRRRQRLLASRASLWPAVAPTLLGPGTDPIAISGLSRINRQKSRDLPPVLRSGKPRLLFIARVTGKAANKQAGVVRCPLGEQDNGLASLSRSKLVAPAARRERIALTMQPAKNPIAGPPVAPGVGKTSRPLRKAVRPMQIAERDRVRLKAWYARGK